MNDDHNPQFWKRDENCTNVSVTEEGHVVLLSFRYQHYYGYGSSAEEQGSKLSIFDSKGRLISKSKFNFEIKESEYGGYRIVSNFVMTPAETIILCISEYDNRGGRLLEVAKDGEVKLNSFQGAVSVISSETLTRQVTSR